MAISLVFVQALSGLHAGAGQGTGVIDLPIARERSTNLPVVPGSSIKGCLRDVCKNEDRKNWRLAFGPERDNAAEYAGALHFGDARLALLPLRCLSGTFVWATSPYVLRRLARDAAAAGTAAPPVVEVGDNQARVSSEDCLFDRSKLVLEDHDFAAAVTPDKKCSEWFEQRIFPNDPLWKAEFRKRFAVIDDKSFFFLAEVGTEVNAHIAIDHQKGTVSDGGLWYQESLPAETILVSLLHSEAARKKGEAASEVEIMGVLKAEEYVQLGGKATTGQGLVRIVRS